MNDRPYTSSQIREWLASYVGQLLGIPAGEVDPAFAFEAYGIDSSAAVGMSGDLGDLLGVEFDASLAYDFPTINAVLEHLVSSGVVAPSPGAGPVA